MATFRRPQLIADSRPQSAIPLSRRIGLMLHLAAHRVRDLIQQRFDHFDISPLQYVMLALAEAAGEDSLAEAQLHHLLRAHRHATLPDSTQLVDRGLLQRHSAPEPPHNVSFHITDVGSTVLSILDPLVREIHDALKGDFTDEEWEQGLHFLRRLSGMDAISVVEDPERQLAQFLCGNRSSLPFTNSLDRG